MKGLNLTGLAMIYFLLNACQSQDEYGSIRDRNSAFSSPYRPQYQPPQYQAPSYIPPRSMNYGNPYAIQNPYGNEAYGIDQYYVAPRYYYNVEPEQQRFDGNNRY